MNDIISFAVVLAINLFLLGVIIAAGLTLAFRFIENVSPRLRYIIAVLVFLLAIIVPLAATLNAPGASVEDYMPAASITGEAITDGAGITELDRSPAAFSRPDPVNEITGIIAGSPVGGIFLLIWAIGFAYLLFREASGFRQLRLARRKWESATEAERTLLQCPEDISLYFSVDQSPGTVGSFNPVMVLPREWPDDLSVEAKRLVVQHETAHARWHDPLVNSFLRVVRAFFWVSPALSLIGRLIESEREAAADHAAITSLSNEPEMEARVLVYAETLMAVAKNLNSFGGNRSTIGLKGSRSKLESRVRRLLSASRTSHLQIAAAAAAFVMSLAVMTVIPVAALPDKAGDSPAESGGTNVVVMETIQTGFDSPAPPGTIAGMKKAADRKPVIKPVPKAAARGSGRQSVKLSPLSPLRGQLAPLKTDHMAPLKTDHMVQLSPLDPPGR